MYATGRGKSIFYSVYIVIVAPCTQYSCDEVDDRDKHDDDLMLARTYQQQ